jgi:5-oxoprolinase (ATP-hydrolysing)
MARWMEELAGDATAALEREGVPRGRVDIRRRIVNLRFSGQESALQVEYAEEASLERAFEETYRNVFGHWQSDRPIEVESIRVVASSRSQGALNAGVASAASARLTAPPPPRRRAWFGGRWHDVAAYERDDLPAGESIDGPALVFERYSVIVVESGWTAAVDKAGAVVLGKGAGRREARRRPARTESRRGERREPASDVVRLELFVNRFGSIAREMGEMLRRTAVSTNVKERLDFSCAVLDSKGHLVVNAPHIPVHLGAMGLCVRALRGAVEMGPGDVVVTNHPRFGGSHLPDVTVVTPVHLPDGRLLAYVANRAHHAELGGARPGSMPPSATSLAEEGVVIPPTHLFRGGEARWDAVQHLLTEGPWPSRSPGENLADLRAAVAANRDGAAALLGLAAVHGADTVWHFMDALEARAERKLRESLAAIRTTAPRSGCDSPSRAIGWRSTSPARPVFIPATSTPHRPS